MKRLNTLILNDARGTTIEEDCQAAPLGRSRRQTVAVENDCQTGRPFLLNAAGDGQTRFICAPDALISALPDGFRLVYSAHAPAGPTVLHPDAARRWRRFAAPRPLDGALDEQLAEQGLLCPAGAPLEKRAGQPETLTAWLSISNACSLDCPYCYVRKSSAHMSEATGLQALDAIFGAARRGGFRAVKLKYAGGEASLHFRLVRRLHAVAAEMAERDGLTLHGVMLTNAVHIRPADADWLAENDIRLMVSLDGVGELHNALRPMKNRPDVDTFARVARTVDEILLPRGLRPSVAMTVTGVNAHGAADVAHWAMVERGLPTTFNFYRQNLLSTPHAELQLEEQAIIDGMLAAYRVVERHLPQQQSYLDGLLDRVQGAPHTHTCGVGSSYLVINHEGDLSQCQMHLDRPVGSALEGDPLSLVAAGPVQNLPVEEKEGCRECDIRYHCSGGCPIETFRATGRWDVKSPHCRIYKTLFPELLRLEGLRLMKAHGYLN